MDTATQRVRIMALITRHEWQSVRGLAYDTGLSKWQVQRRLRELAKEGRVRLREGLKPPCWELVG